MRPFLNKENPDRHLVQSLLKGEQHAFERFFDHYFPRLFRFAMSRLDFNPQESEDVVQTCMSKALTKLHTYRGEAPLIQWLFTFCTFEISRRRKKLATLKAKEIPLAQCQSAEDALMGLRGPVSPENLLLKKELIARIHQTLDTLPHHYSAILELKYLEKWSVKAIANHLGLTAKAAESLLGRARAGFRESFTRNIKKSVSQENP